MLDRFARWLGIKDEPLAASFGPAQYDVDDYDTLVREAEPSPEQPVARFASMADVQWWDCIAYDVTIAEQLRALADRLDVYGVDTDVLVYGFLVDWSGVGDDEGRQHPIVSMLVEGNV